MAEPRFSEKCKVTIAPDSMSATLILDIPSDGIAYSIEELSDFLKNKGVYSGIIYSRLESMAQDNIYLKDVVVAEGSYPVEGQSGYFDIFFDNEKKKKPTIRSDGSVDYQSMSAIENVRAGDKLMQYHPAVPGTQGVDVRGRSLRCNPIKELPALRGTGFTYDEDTGIYSAQFDGRIEYSNNNLYVRDVYEFKGDVDFVVGRIDFRGDVVIHGNVLTDTYIRAGKTITVEGSVEGATLIAEGDIILRKGLQGDKKANVKSGGSVYANFIEFATVEAKENVEANIIMNSTVTAGKDIIVSGKRGTVVGGNNYAIGIINSTNIGNMAGHKTIMASGTTKELTERKTVLELKHRNAKNSMKVIEAEILKIQDVRIPNERKEVREAKLSQLNRRKKRDERMIRHIDDELNEINEKIAIASHSKIMATNNVFSGSKIIINGIEKDITSNMKNTEFLINEETGEIEFRNIN